MFFSPMPAVLRCNRSKNLGVSCSAGLQVVSFRIVTDAAVCLMPGPVAFATTAATSAQVSQHTGNLAVAAGCEVPFDPISLKLYMC
jgi:hypothetical protein